MVRTIALFAALASVIALVSLAVADEKKGDSKVPPVLNFKMKTIDGKEVELSKYQGKVVLFVNVASKCGLTDKQYKGLQELHEKYAKMGLAIVGVPANEFGEQEPGSNKEISEFCTTKYGVKFDMLSKVVVKGDGIAPLYQFLTEKKTNPKYAGEIKWNFTKFLVSRDGEVIGRFEPRVDPLSDDVVRAIESELARK